MAPGWVRTPQEDVDMKDVVTKYVALKDAAMKAAAMKAAAMKDVDMKDNRDNSSASKMYLHPSLKESVT